MTCFHCPQKWHCAIWLHGLWNVNKPLCNCIDDRLIALDNPFHVDKKLLEEVKKTLYK